ncbi:MAG: DinB family protein [Chitinophagaceae bacterium]
MPRPDLKKVPVFFHQYIKQVEENEILTALQDQAISFSKLLRKIPADKLNYRYAKGKWTIKEMVQHIIDTERIFAYRALCISRKESAPLPGFDENLYAANSKAGKRNWKEMLEEIKVVRAATIFLYKSFDKNQMNAMGISNDYPISVLGIGFIIAGHINHHKKVLIERYL